MKVSIEQIRMSRSVLAFSLLLGGTCIWVWADPLRETETERLAEPAMGYQIVEQHNQNAIRQVLDIDELTLNELRTAAEGVREAAGTALSRDLAHIKFTMALQAAACVLWLAGISMLALQVLRERAKTLPQPVCPPAVGAMVLPS